MDGTAILTTINQLTVAGVCALAAWRLWAAYTNQVKEHISDLKVMRQKEIEDLKLDILMLKDRLGMPHKTFLGDDDPPRTPMVLQPTSHKSP